MGAMGSIPEYNKTFTRAGGLYCRLMPIRRVYTVSPVHSIYVPCVIQWDCKFLNGTIPDGSRSSREYEYVGRRALNEREKEGGGGRGGGGEIGLQGPLEACPRACLLLFGNVCKDRTLLQTSFLFHLTLDFKESWQGYLLRI